jgi:cytochrome c oxidase assembly factor CtaG
LLLLSARSPERGVGVAGLGLGAVAVALLSPLDTAARVLFSAHMAQHLLLTVVAAPLLVLGTPRHGVVRVLPAPAARALGRSVRRLGAHRPRQRPVAWLAGATAVHLLVMTAWHAPALYQAGLAVGPIHALQHVTMLGSAVAFWAAVALAARRGDLLAGVLGLVVASLQGVVLGALLALAPTPWYDQLLAPEEWAVSALADQQIAGLLMWVPGGVVYLVGVTALLHRALSESPLASPPAAHRPDVALSRVRGTSSHGLGSGHGTAEPLPLHHSEHAGG